MEFAFTRPQVPVPASVSEQAQRFLAAPMPERGARPPLDDVEGWLTYIDRTNERIVMRHIGQEYPVDVDECAPCGVHTYVLRPHDLPSTGDSPVYLNIHGGGLTAGGGDACRLMALADACFTGMISWAPNYRMPPLHPYPVPLDDCMAVYRHLLQERSPDRIFLGGSSAGGNLATAMLVRAKDEGLPLPRALVLRSPEVDLTESGDSFRVNDGIDNVIGSLMPMNLLYANGHDLTDPYVSPLFADLSGFPPTLIEAGTRDLFLSNAVRIHRKLRSAGVEAELHVFEAMPHGGFGGSPEDIEVRTEIRRFLDQHRHEGI